MPEFEIRKLTSAEIERNAMYVKYKKSKILYDKTLAQGNDSLELKADMQSNLNQFLLADEAFPMEKRLWKNGYSLNTAI